MVRFPLVPAVLVAAAAVAGPLIAAPASARAADSGKANAGPGFSIAAVGTDSYFRYRVAAGERARGRVRLVSTSPRTVRVMLLAADVGTAATGGLEYGATQARGVDPVLRLARQGVRLDPGASVEVPFTVATPPDAAPGDRFAGIVALNRSQIRAAQQGSQRKGFSLRYLPRLAIAVQVTLPGPAKRELTVGNVGIDVTPSSSDVTVLLRNSGDKLIRRTKGQLAVSQNGRELVRRKVDLSAFVPATRIQYRVPLVGRPAEGSYRVTGVLRPERGAPVRVDETVSFGARAAREFKRETGREATRSGPSGLLVGALVAAVLAVLVLVAALVRAQRRLRANDDAGSNTGDS